MVESNRSDNLKCITRTKQIFPNQNRDFDSSLHRVTRRSIGTNLPENSIDRGVIPKTPAYTKGPVMALDYSKRGSHSLLI